MKHMFEKYNPSLANIEIEGRGPAIPKRMSNFYRFVPYRYRFYRKAINKLSEISIGRSLWSIRNAGNYTSYSRMEWRQNMLKFAEQESLFQPSKMRSRKLYRLDQLQSSLSQSKPNEFRYEEFLGRIMTVEMAMRSVDVALE